ncbi:DUF3119 family protein [Chroococcidiopsis sp. TS-821]|uniref:DUF3119 family protein n=1 Tax=Chroococcidiopsis sp. TS-821 TaxID=1378066 RepID=UPI000CEF172A|nr:DUF3119 family protein [Chroococcidiopsis sp. TS-821]PPS45504.1 glycerol dehydrogenase [Chroococcidiopsis sp. TS-821]
MTPSSPLSSTTIELAPSYKLPIAIAILAILLLLVSPWLGGAIALFGLFLMFQAGTLRLQFTDTALDIYRGENLIRHFPYQDWENWEIFWFNVPILFYFKEVKSIHFLPIIFDPKLLKSCLEQRFPKRTASS